MLKEKSKILDMEYSEIKKQVKNVLAESLDIRQLQNTIDTKVELFDDIYLFDDYFEGIIEIYVSNLAGRFKQKELMEKLGFEISEEEYNNNREEVLYITEDLIFPAIEEYVNENIDVNNSIGFHFGYTEQGDIALMLMIDHTYIPQKVKDKRIVSTDVSLIESLYFYSTFFKVDDYIIFVKGNFDKENIYYQKLNFDDKQDIINFIEEELDNNILNYLGKNKDKGRILLELKDLLNENMEKEFFRNSLNYISSILDYYSINVRLNKAEHHIELLQKIGVM